MAVPVATPAIATAASPPKSNPRQQQKQHAAFRFRFLVGLAAMSSVYVSLGERFLLSSSQRQTEWQRDAVSSSWFGGGDDRGAERDTPEPEPSYAAVATIQRKNNYRKSFSPLSYPSSFPENATQALEHILGYYPLEVEDRRTVTRQVPKPPPSRPFENVAPLNASTVQLSDLIDEETWQVKAPIHNQLDFVIIGNPKTGTTFLQSVWFAAHPDIHMPAKECRAMPQKDGPAKIVQLMHSLRADNENMVNSNNNNSSLSSHAIYGYKNPQDINRPNALVNFHQYFPYTKLIVGLRHPVTWFESFYNYRNSRGGNLPPPENLIGECQKEFIEVCTDNGNFHAGLAGLGLTDRSSQREQALLSTRRQQRRPLKPGLENPIFLFEQTQLDVGVDANFSEALRQDLSSFLGLHTPLPPLVRTYRPEHLREFSICEPQYKALRQELLRIGSAAGSWIREFFLDQSTVFVSSRKEFEKLLAKWAEDPCEGESQTKMTQHASNETLMSV